MKNRNKQITDATLKYAAGLASILFAASIFPKEVPWIVAVVFWVVGIIAVISAKLDWKKLWPEE